MANLNNTHCKSIRTSRYTRRGIETFTKNVITQSITLVLTVHIQYVYAVKHTYIPTVCTHSFWHKHTNYHVCTHRHETINTECGPRNQKTYIWAAVSLTLKTASHGPVRFLIIASFYLELTSLFGGNHLKNRNKQSEPEPAIRVSLNLPTLLCGCMHTNQELKRIRVCSLLGFNP